MLVKLDIYILKYEIDFFCLLEIKFNFEWIKSLNKIENYIGIGKDWIVFG